MLGLTLNYISKREPWNDCKIIKDKTPQQQSVKDRDNTLYLIMIIESIVCGCHGIKMSY